MTERARLVGVVPAAGRAARLQPLAGSKEMLPVRGRPVMDYVLERLSAAGPAEVRVVTRPEKQDVVAHAERHGARVVLGHPPSFSASLLLGTAGLDPEDVVLVGLPDTVWEPPDGFVRLVAALRDGVEAVLGAFRSPEPERSDVVSLAEDGRVAAVDVKPARPRSDRVWGCVAARARALAGLADHAEPGHLFDALARAGRVEAVCFDTELVDIGTRASLERAARLATAR